MSSIHLHLLLNHVPVIGSVLGVLLLAAALARRSDELGKAALGLFTLLAAASVVVFFTGEPAEELVEKLPGFSEAVTERHEDVALIAVVVMGLTGLFCLITLAVFRRRPLAGWVTPVALIASLGTVGIMGYTANLGGQIRHTELRASTRVIPEGDADEDAARTR
jgi:uncharacterized membrane protein